MNRLYGYIFLAAFILFSALASSLIFLAARSALHEDFAIGVLYLAGAALSTSKLLRILRETYQ
jgi:ABC-type Mn2+/Zn2+ transport system permease subunit